MKKLVCLLLVVSCTTTSLQTDIETVSLNSSKNSNLKIEEQINSQGSDLKKNDESNEKPRDVLVSLSIYSSLYSSLALVNFFKKAEKEKLKISTLNASGFAAIICALYAKEVSSNTLEWKLFKLLKKIKGIKPFSKSWSSEIQDFLEDEFGKMRLSELKILTQIPFLNPSGSEVKLVKEALVASILMKTIDLSNKENYLLKPQIYNRNLMEYSSDVNFNLVFLPQKVAFKLIDGYSWGIYTTHLGFLIKNKAQIHHISTLKNLPIDALVPLSEINAAYKNSTDEFFEKMNLELNAWKEENTSSSN